MNNGVSSLKRKKYTTFNILMSCVLQLASIVIALVIPNKIITVYGSESNGLVSWVTQIFNLFQLLEGGVSVAAAVALFKPFADGDTEKITGIYRSIAKYYKKSGELLLCLSIVSSAVFALMFAKSGLDWYVIISIVMITGITNSLNFLLLGKFNVVCDADQHTFVLHIFTLTAKIVVFVIQYVLILLRKSLIAVELPVILMVVIRLLMTYLYVKKRYPYLLDSKGTEEIKFNQKGDALIIQVANLLKRNAPMIVLGLFGDLVMLSIYNVYASVFHASSSLLEMASQSLTSNFGNLVVTEEKKKVSNVYRRAEWIMTALLSVIMCCYMKLIIPFIKVYSRNFDSNYVFVIMAVLFTVSELIANLGVLPRMAAISCGYIKESRNPAIIEALAALVIGFACYYFFGMSGLMVGCIAGSLVRTFYHIFFVSGKILNEKFSESIVVIAVNAILCAASLFAADIIKTDPSSYSGRMGYVVWGLTAVAVFVISAIIIFGGNIIAYRIFSRFRRK